MLYQCIFENGDCKYHAFVYATNDDDLFWAIDEFFSPLDCKIYPIQNLSFCVKSDDDFMSFDELEISEKMHDDVIEKRKDYMCFQKTSKGYKLKKCKG